MNIVEKKLRKKQWMTVEILKAGRENNYQVDFCITSEIYQYSQ